MSDDDDNGLAGHLANIARKHQAPPPQPQAGKVGVARVGRFHGKGGAWRDEKGSTVSTVILWDTETGKWQFVELFHETSRAGDPRPVAGMALAPDERRIALAFDTATPVIWRITGDLPSYKP